jgi:hypothetical protein
MHPYKSAWTWSRADPMGSDLQSDTSVSSRKVFDGYYDNDDARDH